MEGSNSFDVAALAPRNNGDKRVVLPTDLRIYRDRFHTEDKGFAPADSQIYINTQ